MKFEFPRFVQSKGYKTINTHELHEYIPYNEKNFTKRKRVIKFETKTPD